MFIKFESLIASTIKELKLKRDKLDKEQETASNKLFNKIENEIREEFELDESYPIEVSTWGVILDNYLKFSLIDFRTDGSGCFNWICTHKNKMMKIGFETKPIQENAFLSNKENYQKFINTLNDKYKRVEALRKNIIKERREMAEEVRIVFKDLSYSIFKSIKVGDTITPYTPHTLNYPMTIKSITNKNIIVSVLDKNRNHIIKRINHKDFKHIIHQSLNHKFEEIFN